MGVGRSQCVVAAHLGVEVYMSIRAERGEAALQALGPWGSQAWRVGPAAAPQQGCPFIAVQMGQSLSLRPGPSTALF